MAFDAKWFSGGGDSSSYTTKKKDDLATAAYNADVIKKQAEKKKEDDKSALDHTKDFFGGVGGFLKDVAVSVKDDAKNAYTGIKDTVEGTVATNEQSKLSEGANKIQTKFNKQINDIYGKYQDAGAVTADGGADTTKMSKADLDKIARLQKEKDKQLSTYKTDTNFDVVSEKHQKEFDESQKVDAKKTAFAAASTFLNATGVYGLAEAGAKTVGVQASKALSKNVVEQMVKTGGTEALEQIIKSGSKEAAESAVKTLTKRVGEEAADTFFKRAVQRAAPEAMMGAGYGVVQTGTNSPDATAGDFVKGAVIGGGVGAVAGVAGEGISTAKKAIAERAVTKEAAKTATREAEQLLKLSPEDYAQKMGVTTEQATKELEDLAVNGTEIADKGIKAKINNIFSPVKNLGERTQESFKANAGQRNVAEFKARAVETQLKEAADQSGTKLTMDLAHQIENGTAPETAFTAQFRTIADQTRKEATEAGLDIGYRENYVPHIWKQSADEVDKIARGAGLKARAEGERVIPTYQEGLDLGLKPKYTDPAKMMGDYVKNLENTRANVALLTDLRDQGILKSGRPPAGWKTVSAEGFPRTANGNQLSAPKEVAHVLNNIYGTSDSLIDKGLRKTAKFNSMWQDIALAGGIPHTPANFFTFSQAMKETALGLGQMVTGSPIRGAKTIYSPTASFLRSFSNKQTQKFVEANSGLIEAMAKRGAPINFAESTVGRTTKEAAKDAIRWDKLFNEPTFGRFMPSLQLSTAKNVQNALEKKLGREAALDLTAETLKKMYGITDQLATGRSQAVQDMIGTVAFAPKYRESIINVLANTVKSLNPATYGDKSFSLNRRLAVGIGVTYMIYDQLNRQTTGHGIADNPEGKDLSLAIPYGGKDDKGNDKVIYIPFMPSFMTLPRAGVAAVQDIAKGDQRGVASEGGKLLSMPIQTIAQLATNKDYFGRPIYNDEENARATHTEADSAGTALGKQGLYVAGQALPGMPRAALNQAQGKPTEQNVATALELPVRFGTTSPRSTKEASYSPGQVTSDWYDIYNPVSAKRRTVSAEVTDLIKQGKPGEASRRANEFNDSLNTRFSKYYKKYGGNPSDDKMWDEMLDSLAIKTSKRSFKARLAQTD